MAGADVGIFGGSGFYSFLEDVEEVEARHAVRQAVGALRGRRDRRRAGRLPPASRAQPRAAAARDPVPGERLGDEGARRPPDHRAERLGRAEGRARSSASSSSATSSSTARAAARTPSTTAPRRRTSPRPTRTAPTCARCSSRPRASSGIPVRDGGTVVDDPGPTLLDARRVALVPGRRLGRDQHDRVPGGLSRPRARALLREHLDGHRPRRRRRGHRRRSRTSRS